MEHGIVQSSGGKFYGWPANNGIWSWGNEILVGFTEAEYMEKDKGHSFNQEGPRKSVLSRSLDGGSTWKLECPEAYPEGFSFGDDGADAGAEISNTKAPIDFLAPDLAIRCRDRTILVSQDRGHTWDGTRRFPAFGFSESLTSRTDYLPLSRDECLFFISVKDPQVKAGIRDRAFAVRTSDGGRSFERLGFLLPETPELRSVMPSTVRVSERSLVSALRRRVDVEDTEGAKKSRCWIDAAISEDLGSSWRFLSKITDTHTDQSQHNGNPPSMVRLHDGRLCLVYGYRAAVMGMKVRISADEGATWSGPLSLRDDARTWDFGYPRSVVRPDGKVLSVYYYTTEAHKEQHIAYTIWTVDELGS